MAAGAAVNALVVGRWIARNHGVIPLLWKQSLLNLYIRHCSSRNSANNTGVSSIFSDRNVVVEHSGGAETIEQPRNSKKSKDNKFARLRVHGPDRRGIVASFAQIIHRHGCCIVDSASEQSVDAERGIKLFFQRIVFDYSGWDKVKGRSDGSDDNSSNRENEVDDTEMRSSLASDVQTACEEFGMHSDLNWGDRRWKVGIMVGRYDHCLWELLLRQRAGELDCDICAVISNHHDLRPVAETFGVPYHVFEITRDNKAYQERQELELLEHVYSVDLVVLARYMQILSEDFVREMPNRIINIHHSFLPAFMGERPYHRAHERGVKLIGATAHYTTVDLDEGPIIDQDITRITHRDNVNSLIRKGRTLERNVLVHAVRAHLEDRIIVYKNKCIVFGE